MPLTGAVGASAAPDYPSRVQPIFNRRCIACHGCLASPRNVKLDSFAGAERGGFGKNPYSTHLTGYPRTDMNAADSTSAWRKRGFYPILADSGSPRQNVRDSLLFALVAAGMRHNVAEFSRAALDGLRPQSATRQAVRRPRRRSRRNWRRTPHWACLSACRPSRRRNSRR